MDSGSRALVAAFPGRVQYADHVVARAGWWQLRWMDLGGRCDLDRVKWKMRCCYLPS